jgi:hypothetical protein
MHLVQKVTFSMSCALSKETSLFLEGIMQGQFYTGAFEPVGKIKP